MGDAIDFNVEYIGGVKEDGTLTCLHGPDELDENLRQICARELYPDYNRYMNYIVCRSRNLKDEEWSSCLSEYGMDPEVMRDCLESRGENLLRESFEYSKEVGARASPTIFLQLERYKGRRDVKYLATEVCEILDGRHPYCGTLPKSEEFEIVIIDDKTCLECDSAYVEEKLRKLYPKAEHVRYDIGDEEGLRLFEDNKLRYLPAILIGAEIKKDLYYDDMRRYLKDTGGGYLRLDIGSKYEPEL
jgi:hypothetical protein